MYRTDFGLYGRSRGWDDLREQHQNMYIIKCETDRQSRLDAWDKCSGLVHWEDPEGWDGEGGGRGVQDGEHTQIHGSFIHSRFTGYMLCSRHCPESRKYQTTQNSETPWGRQPCLRFKLLCEYQWAVREKRCRGNAGLDVWRERKLPDGKGLRRAPLRGTAYGGTMWVALYSDGWYARGKCRKWAIMEPSGNTVYSSQDMEAASTSIDRGMHKEEWFTYTTEYYSATERNEIMPFVATWMDLEIITLSHRMTNVLWCHINVES